MPPCQKTIPNKVESSKVLLSRGLALVLKRVPPSSKKLNRKQRNRKKEQPCKECEEIAECDFGPEVFLDWIRENEECYWNPCLVQSVKSLEYKGFVRPATLLVGGTDYSLEVVRSAWSRRMLRPPHGYDILMLGDLDVVSMSLVSQTQFAPLPEALCKAVYDLTSEGFVASIPVISKKLKSAFPELILPSENILCKTLGTLIKERKLFHTGSGYAVVTPDTFRLLAMSPPLERQMLLTNEEAIVRLHGTAYTVDDGRTTCTQTQQQEILTAWSSAERILEPRKHGKLKRCHSLKLLRGERLSRSNSFKSNTHQDFRNSNEAIKKKSPSMFSKWFRRGRIEKNRMKCSSTQFPPRDTSDPDYVIYNSRSTQTLDKIKVRSSSLNRSSGRDRHSQHMSSIPATPRICHRNRQHMDDHRSSSLSRKTSPKRETPPSPKTQEFKTHESRNRQETSFYHLVKNKEQESQLMANEKYGNSHSGMLNTWNKVTPYQTTDILKSQNVFEKLPSFTPPLLKKPEWKRPTSWVSTTPSDPAKSPARLTPQFTSTPNPQLIETTKSPPGIAPKNRTQTIVDSLKTSETITETVPQNGKEFSLGTTVDVEISVSNNKIPNATLLTTDLDDRSVKNDLLKIATTWNQSIKSSKGVKASDFSTKPGVNIPKVTTTTNITTSVSREHNKGDVNVDKTENNENMKVGPVGLKRSTLMDFSMGRDSPSSDTVRSVSPRSTETKSEFFGVSPNTTVDIHMGKEDSGFSSSTSTSRPMSVSPC
ncbi:uncharacterized protein [Parasteatoda tepidariorum]|uniref:uncharacterized protein isoform X2 n=1 Tax=Parasteatoda tepidariorum TaxID=114398 RepID=UPI0039BC9F55